MMLYPGYPTGEKTERDFSLLFYYSFINVLKMKTVIKQVVGIDVAQDELVATLGLIYFDMETEFIARKVFKNTKSDRKKLHTWAKKNTDPKVGLRFVMEATGVYHERFAYFLDENELDVSIVLPNKISNYMRTLEVKTINDKKSADAIAQFGLERKLDNWHRPKALFRELRQLTRERDQVVQDRTIAKNQLHAEKTEAMPNKSTLKRLKERIKLHDKQEQQIKTEVDCLIKTDLVFAADIKRICTIKGVGKLTAVTILAETQGFDLIRNKAQLTSYAGLDVKEKQSGTSVKGKSKISKRGNKYLRKCLYFPALAAVRSDGDMKSLYVRLLSKHGIKKKAGVAVQRKLLELVYIIYKTGATFDPNYMQKKQALLEKQRAEKEANKNEAQTIPEVQKTPEKQKATNVVKKDKKAEPIKNIKRNATVYHALTEEDIVMELDKSDYS